MFVFGTFETCGTFGTFGTCLALDCSEHLANIDQHQSKKCQNQPKTPKVNMLNLGMSVLILVSNGDIQRSNRICSQNQQAQAQHWLRQAQLMHTQQWPRTQSCSRQGRPPLLSMHELSLSMPEPMLSLYMLILAACPEMFGTLFGTFATFGTSQSFGAFLDP